MSYPRQRDISRIVKGVLEGGAGILDMEIRPDGVLKIQAQAGKPEPGDDVNAKYETWKKKRSAGGV